MSHRKEQIESTLRRAISQVLVRKLSDPRVVGLVGVTRVSVSDDLRKADVFITVVPDKYEKRTLAGLRAAVGYIHEQTPTLADMRSVPHFHFALDAELKKQESIYDAIAKGMDREGIDASQVKHLTGEPGEQLDAAGEDDAIDDESDDDGFDDEAEFEQGEDDSTRSEV